MSRKRINPSLEKKYSRRTGSIDEIRGQRGEKKQGKESRNLGLLSLFFILLATVIIVGKLTMDGQFVRSPSSGSSSSLPTVTRVEQNLDNSSQKAAIPTENPITPLIVKADKPAEETSVPEEPPKIAEKKYQSRLFFLKINDEGQILLKSILRNITYEDGLLTATLDSLLSGPSQDDLIKGFFTLIPNETVINDVTIRDGIAWIDVNESFRYNHLGYEGYLAQLKQLVFTATEFSSVQGVKITIDGREEEFLSAEGISIRGILSQDTF